MESKLDTDDGKDKSALSATSSPPKFLYGDLLGAALVAPLLVILAFGGRPSMMVLCFGGLGAYIFDLLGSAEVAILFLSIMFMSLWVSLIWAAKFLLRDSILNFHLVAIMGIILLYTFLLCTAVFNSIRREFDGGLRLFEACAFATLPLFSASLLTWFLCIEMPDLSLPAVFMVTYYAYAYVLTKPRVNSEAVNEARRVGSTDGLLSGRNLVLHSVPLRLTVLFLPMVMVPALYCFMYRPYVLRTFSKGIFTFERLSGLILSFVGPGYLTCALVQETFDVYFKDSFPRPRTSGNLVLPLALVNTALEGVKLTGLCVAALCLESSPFLNDLRDHSGMERRTCTMVLASIGLLLGMALMQFRRGHVAYATFGPSFGAKKDDDMGARGPADTSGRTGLTVSDNRSAATKASEFATRLINGSFLPRTLTAIAITGAAFLTALLLRMPAESLSLSDLRLARRVRVLRAVAQRGLVQDAGCAGLAGVRHHLHADRHGRAAGGSGSADLLPGDPAGPGVRLGVGVARSRPRHPQRARALRARRQGLGGPQRPGPLLPVQRTRLRRRRAARHCRPRGH